VVAAVLIAGCLLWLAIYAEKQLPQTGGGVDRPKNTGLTVDPAKSSIPVSGG